MNFSYLELILAVALGTYFVRAIDYILYTIAKRIDKQRVANWAEEFFDEDAEFLSK